MFLKKSDCVFGSFSGDVQIERDGLVGDFVRGHRGSRAI